VPIRASAEQIAAYFLVGPMMVGQREDELQFTQRVSALGLDASALWSLILSLKLYTFVGIRSALNLMEEVGSSVVQLAYQAKQLAAILPATSQVDNAVIAYHTDRVLHALLEAATLATKAEGGSIMVYGPQRDAMQIKVAQGLSGGVLANTRVKRGEGLAGLAIAERSILLIDEQTASERIKHRMHRHELVSSLVAPLMPDANQEPIGVLSLRTTNPLQRFTPEHTELLRRLLDLALTALGSLRFAFNN
jgi:GAF domain-containing protein